jgi:ATP-dependent RNA/DNA helicase IGHMBP2
LRRPFYFHILQNHPPEFFLLDCLPSSCMSLLTHKDTSLGIISLSPTFANPMKYQDAIEELSQVATLLRIEQKADFEQHENWLRRSSVQERKKNGLTWFPLRIVESGYGMGDYPFLVVERHDIQTPHHFQAGTPAQLFSLADGNNDEVLNGSVVFADNARMKLSFTVDEIPDWVDDGKIGVNVLFDSKTYDEMFKALNLLINIEKGRTKELRDLLLGYKSLQFRNDQVAPSPFLNESQNAARASMLNAEDVAIIHGPPGTGKTTTLVEGIHAMAQRGEKILVCAPSNAATDHLASSLNKRGLRVVRIGNMAKVDAENEALTLEAHIQTEKDFKQIREIKKRAIELRRMASKYKRNFGKAEADQRKLILQEARNMSKEARELEDYLVEKVLNQCDVIATTLIGSTSGYLSNRRFNTVVIDEAGQGLEAGVWVPLLKADKAVLAGDPFQLPPTVKSQEAARMGLSDTLLEKTIQRHAEISLLQVQYRMHEEIMAYSNLRFYNNQLSAHPNNQYRGLAPDELVVEFIDTAGCGYDEQAGEDGDSLQNKEEASLLERHFAALSSRYNEPWTVGILSPYRAQVRVLQDMAIGQDNANIQMTINTIDSFQGQERDIIYISLVRSNDRSEIGFLKDYRRMNVAMTRARKKLVLIGDSATLGNDSFYAGLLEMLENKGCYRTAWEYYEA